MRHIEQLRLGRSLAQRVRTTLESIDLDQVEDLSHRAKVLGIASQAQLLEQHLQDAISLLGAPSPSEPSQPDA